MSYSSTDANNVIFEMAAAFVNETSEHVFLTGKAGTGKTTFLRHIRGHTHKSAVVAAPTGVAAINAGGVTLHSLFQLPFEPFVPGYVTQKNKFRFGKAKLDLLRQLELLIIDEVSMLRADTLDAIDKTLRGIRRNSQPFGGIQVLYIGDIFQLPPVVKDDEWKLLKPYYDSSFFFHSQVVMRTQPVYLELKYVYRQREQRFIDLLNNVRNNCLSDADLALLYTRYQPHFTPAPEEKYITLTTHNYKADRMNRQELDKLPSREYTFTGTVEGDFPDYALPTDLNLCLKVGAQVMFIKNDPNGRYFNGKIAVVSSLSSDSIEVKMADSDEVIRVGKERWPNNKYSLNKETGEMKEEEIGSYMQYPLRLAWAVTIHKSQGLTFDKAIIDIGESFAPGQAYVALSRCTSLEGIVLRTPVTPHCIMTDTHAIDFSQTEKSVNELHSILAEGKRKFWRERLVRYFDWKPMVTFLREFDRLLEDKVSEEFEPVRMLVEDFRKAVNEMNDVADKFRSQLNTLIEQAEQTDNLSILRERCQKAVMYFHETTISQILLPLQSLITNFNLPKRANTFRKNVVELEGDVVLFLENMKRIRYNNVPFADTLELSIPARKDLLNSPSKVTAKTKPAGRTKGLPKVDTRRASLALFAGGLSVKEIAEQRQLAVSTIEGHLAEFIGDEVPVEKIFTPDELAELSTVIRPLLHVEKPSFRAAYERTGGKYSFGKLKMAFNYLKKNGTE